MKYPRKNYWMSLETGELLTLAEAVAIAEEEYDFCDYTNAVEFYEYFEYTEIEVEK